MCVGGGGGVVCVIVLERHLPSHQVRLVCNIISTSRVKLFVCDILYILYVVLF